MCKKPTYETGLDLYSKTPKFKNFIYPPNSKLLENDNRISYLALILDVQMRRHFRMYPWGKNNLYFILLISNCGFVLLKWLLMFAIFFQAR